MENAPNPWWLNAWANVRRPEARNARNKVEISHCFEIHYSRKLCCEEDTQHRCPHLKQVWSDCFHPKRKAHAVNQRDKPEIKDSFQLKPRYPTPGSQQSSRDQLAGTRPEDASRSEYDACSIYSKQSVHSSEEYSSAAIYESQEQNGHCTQWEERDVRWWAEANRTWPESANSRRIHKERQQRLAKRDQESKSIERDDRSTGIKAAVS